MDFAPAASLAGPLGLTNPSVMFVSARSDHGVPRPMAPPVGIRVGALHFLGTSKQENYRSDDQSAASIARACKRSAPDEGLRL